MVSLGFASTSNDEGKANINIRGKKKNITYIRTIGKVIKEQRISKID